MSDTQATLKGISLRVDAGRPPLGTAAATTEATKLR